MSLISDFFNADFDTLRNDLISNRQGLAVFAQGIIATGCEGVAVFILNPLMVAVDLNNNAVSACVCSTCIFYRYNNIFILAVFAGEITDIS